ncbi:hypothetical protein G7Y89_g7744 [Cudoniella acicularis]|uniref:Uncharacterized protein n=1 Tax=Cudoniella acicularis TaxID=354080 RepID=A0A8H4RLG7_9HELO|nr:hypothetical protein G7Y89_g7744 [Cudoniella acicularis]
MEVDVEANQSDLDLGIDAPLLPKPAQSVRSARTRGFTRQSVEVIELDDIPPIIKSADGNIMWADEQCTRRVGLTATEARLLLCLLQTDEPESYNYEEYKAMFEHFGREQARLEELVRGIHWYNFEQYRQKAIWRERICWLQRMKEPRLWLLYLMARRRRILKQATEKVMVRLREKRLERERNANAQRFQPHGHEINVESPHEQQYFPPMVNEAAQTSETQLSIHPEVAPRPVMKSEGAQTSENYLKSAKQLVTEKFRASLSSGRRSHSSQGRCPVFDERYQATRKDIKLQVEKFMPVATPYIVIGWFSRGSSDPKERILQFETPAELFKAMRKGEKSVRSWRRVLSLKGLRGFGLYKCDISRGAHRPLDLSTSQRSVMSQFYLAYRASNRHADEAVATAWQGWVYKNLNDSKNNPLEGRYSLELIYDWSSYRLCTIVGIPLTLSFVLGMWYMEKTGDIVTAWTIAMYIVTAAAALIALMAIVGSLKDI